MGQAGKREAKGATHAFFEDINFQEIKSSQAFLL